MAAHKPKTPHCTGPAPSRAPGLVAARCLGAGCCAAGAPSDRSLVIACDDVLRADLQDVSGILRAALAAIGLRLATYGLRRLTTQVFRVQACRPGGGPPFCPSLAPAMVLRSWNAVGLVAQLQLLRCWCWQGRASASLLLHWGAVPNALQRGYQSLRRVRPPTACLDDVWQCERPASSRCVTGFFEQCSFPCVIIQRHHIVGARSSRKAFWQGTSGHRLAPLLQPAGRGSDRRVASGMQQPLTDGELRSAGRRGHGHDQPDSGRRRHRSRRAAAAESLELAARCGCAQLAANVMPPRLRPPSASVAAGDVMGGGLGLRPHAGE